MANFTDAQLQNYWNQYVGMKQADVISATCPGSAVFDADFSQAIGIIYSQKMFGFANYGYPAAGSNQFPNNAAIFNGPTKS